MNKCSRISGGTLGMVGTANVQPTIGVSDMEKATGFYGGMLGLKVVREDQYEVVYQSGTGYLSIYQTNYAGSNKATYAAWEVDDVKVEAAKLAAMVRMVRKPPGSKTRMVTFCAYTSK
jgi:catechol 2,3-dioxygenase-like lactoylglutathione lyase family enzyme